MPQYLVVLSNPAEGKEDEYNDWYDNIHLQEVTSLNGFISGQRFRVPAGSPLPSQHKYLALYGIEGDPAAAFNELMAAVPTMNMSDALDTQTTQMMVVEALGNPVLKAGN